MNWLYIATRDFAIYQDAERIKQYVIKGKITAAQFFDITGVVYT
jgi:hypothetical protein